MNEVSLQRDFVFLISRFSVSNIKPTSQCKQPINVNKQMNMHKLPKLLREGNKLHSSIVLITVHSINLSAFYPGKQWAILLSGASLVAQRVKCLLALQETWVRSLGREDPLEKEMATDSSVLAWKIPWTENPGRIQSIGSQRVGHD